MTVLVAYRDILVTPDTAMALRELEAQVRRVKITHGCPTDLVSSDSLLLVTGITAPESSALLTGREVGLTGSEAMVLVAEKLGFRRWRQDSDVYHFKGPFRDLEWKSFVCGAQIQVGTWAGDRHMERSVQTKLYLSKHYAGPIDGVVTPDLLRALREAGFSHKSLTEVIPLLG